MAKKSLKNKSHHDFIQSHILRPYQDAISDNEDSMDYSDMAYGLIEVWIREKPEWSEKVFNRISEIYFDIDASIFPEGKVKTAILYKLKEHDVYINY